MRIGQARASWTAKSNPYQIRMWFTAADSNVYQIRKPLAVWYRVSSISPAPLARILQHFTTCIYEQGAVQLAV